MKRAIAGCIAGIILIFTTAGCVTTPLSRSVPTMRPIPLHSDSSILARLNGQPIIEEDVRQISGSRLLRVQVQFYDVQEEAINQLIEQRLLTAEAARYGLTKDELIKQQVTDSVGVTEEEIAQFYEHSDQMQGKTLQEATEEIRSRLVNERKTQRYADLKSRLRKDATIEWLIQPPVVAVDDGNAPSRGPQKAPVTLIEFGDFQCPYCGSSRPAIAKILETYPDQVRYVFRDFPLPFHTQAMKAHEASYCAKEQGRYWEMNQKLFSNQQALDLENLVSYSQELGLDADPFRACLDTARYADTVQRNRIAGEQAGVTGTPSFFVNGRMIVGSAPFEHFQRIIDQELSK